MTITPQMMLEQPQAQMFIEEHVTKHIHVYFNDRITDPRDYTDVIHTIRKSSQDDTIHLHINSVGGYLSTTLQIIDALQQTDAYVVAYLESEASSCATMLFLCADNWIIGRFSHMMFHNVSYGSVGKAHEIEAMVEFSKKNCEDIVKSLYEGFLTEEEVIDIIRGMDLYMDSEEIYNRLGDLAAYRDEKMEKLEEALDNQEEENVNEIENP